MMNQYLNTGARYNPTTDSWTATSTTSAPAGRYLHTAAWTGSEMIVWGGVDFTYPHHSRLDGSEMIVWGRELILATKLTPAPIHRAGDNCDSHQTTANPATSNEMSFGIPLPPTPTPQPPPTPTPSIVAEPPSRTPSPTPLRPQRLLLHRHLRHAREDAHLRRDRVPLRSLGLRRLLT